MIESSSPTRSTTGQTPEWLDRTLYPFGAHYFDSADGRLHYVDEGSGAPVVLVHGTPTWSFLFRHLISRLATQHRVIAVDHLGFGLSDKPANGPYQPKDHTRRLTALLDSLAISNATFVVHDFGGPIGLGTALAQPDRVARLVLFNTWMWSIADDAAIASGARVAGSWAGRLLYRHLNFPVTALMPKVVGDRRVLTPEIVRHYAAPLASPDERMGAWACARALLHGSPWFEWLWSRRGRLRAKPMLLLWGLKDPTFGVQYLDRWRGEFPNARVHTFSASGHFVPEEAAAEVGPLVEEFLEPDARRAAAAR